MNSVEHQIVEVLRRYLLTPPDSPETDPVDRLSAELADLPELTDGMANYLIGAVREGVPKLLASAPLQEILQTVEVISGALAERRHGDPSDARWAVQCWAAAMRLIPLEAICRQTPAISAPTQSMPTSPQRQPKTPSAAKAIHNVKNPTRSFQKSSRTRYRLISLTVLSIALGIVLAYLALNTADSDHLTEQSVQDQDASLPTELSADSAREPRASNLEPHSIDVENSRAEFIPERTTGDTQRLENGDSTWPPTIDSKAGLNTSSDDSPQLEKKRVSSSQSPQGTTTPSLGDTYEVLKEPREGSLGGIWGERASFPHQLALVTTRIEQARRKATDNELWRDIEIARLEAELRELLALQIGRKVIAKVSVLRAEGNLLFVDSDVSWGWPTVDLYEFNPEDTFEYWSPRHGLICLMNDAAGGRRDMGGSIQIGLGADVTDRYHWSDKVRVRIYLQQVIDRGATAQPRFAAIYSQIEFAEPKLSPVRNCDWPEAGFPHLMAAFASWSYRERRTMVGVPEFESFLAYANRTLHQGVANLRVLKVSNTEVTLSNDVTSPLQGRAGMVYLVDSNRQSEQIAIPIASIGYERASQFTTDTLLHVAFDVVSVEEGAVLIRGKTGFGSRTSAGVKISIRNLRILEEN